MSHVRQQIREAVATALTGLATTGSRVYQERTRDLRDADLPALVITTDDEKIDVGSVSHPPLQERNLSVRVAAVAKATGSLDDTLDTMVAECETALYASVATNTLGGLCKSLTLESIEIEQDDTLDRPAGRAVMTWRTTYFTIAGTPGTAS